MFKIVTALFAPAAFTDRILATVPAAAQNQAEAVTVEVHTEDLNLARSADQARLDKRVEQAIRRACRTGGLEMESRQQEAACRAGLSEACPAVELAIADARSIQLAAIKTNPGA